MLTYILLLVFVLSGLVIVVPFVVQQMADIANLFLDKINSFQSALQQHGLAAVIAESRLPGQFKESLLQAIQSGNLVESAQESLLENMSQIVSLGSDYISNAGSLAVSIVTSFFSAFVQISIVFVVAVFFSIEKDEVIHFLARMSGRVQHTELKLKKLYTKL
jgi:predicted PurR-regulated permease PerM